MPKDTPILPCLRPEKTQNGIKYPKRGKIPVCVSTHFSRSADEILISLSASVGCHDDRL